MGWVVGAVGIKGMGAGRGVAVVLCIVLSLFGTMML